MQEKVLDKIRKLVTLANDGAATEHEAARAMERVHAILAKHNLTMDDVVEHSEAQTRDEMGTVTTDSMSQRYNDPFRRILLAAVADLYFCKYLYQKVPMEGKRSNRMQEGVKHMFIGKAHNAAVARMMGEYLIQTVVRLAHENAKEHSFVTSSKRWAYIRSFCNGATNRLVERMKEQKRAAQHGEVHDTEGNTLPVLASMYDHEMSLAQQYMQETFGKIRRTSTRMTIKDQGAFKDGQTAGDSISLSAQMGAQSSNRKRVGNG